MHCLPAPSRPSTFPLQLDPARPSQGVRICNAMVFKQFIGLQTLVQLLKCVGFTILGPMSQFASFGDRKSVKFEEHVSRKTTRHSGGGKIDSNIKQRP